MASGNGASAGAGRNGTGHSATPQSWDAIANYVSASADESAARMRALMMRLRMPMSALATEWTHPPPLQQEQQNAEVVNTKMSKKKKKKKKSRDRRSVRPCAECRRRHRRCDSEPGKGACGECTRVKLACTFAA